MASLTPNVVAGIIAELLLDQPGIRTSATGVPNGPSGQQHNPEGAEGGQPHAMNFNRIQNRDGLAVEGRGDPEACMLGMVQHGCIIASGSAAVNLNTFNITLAVPATSHAAVNPGRPTHGHGHGSNGPGNSDGLGHDGNQRGPPGPPSGQDGPDKRGPRRRRQPVKETVTNPFLDPPPQGQQSLEQFLQKKNKKKHGVDQKTNIESMPLVDVNGDEDRNPPSSAAATSSPTTTKFRRLRRLRHVDSEETLVLGEYDDN